MRGLETVSKLWAVFRTSSFGSDQFQCYSAEYAWCDNQISHAGMGFFLGVLVALAGRGRPWWIRYLPPYLIPMFKLPSDWGSISAGNSTFRPDVSEFWADKLTDLSFWYFGMFLGQCLATGFAYGSAGKAIAIRLTTAFLAIVWLVVNLCLVSWWTDQKKVFDDSNLPSGWVRVSQIDTGKLFPSSEEGKLRSEMEKATRKYLDFITQENPNEILHCVVRGGWPVNRSDLAAAFGTEFASRRKPVYYFTAGRLIEQPDALNRWKKLAAERLSNAEINDSHPFYPKCLIIDDLSSVYPKPQEFDTRKPLEGRPVYDAEARIQDIFEAVHKSRDSVSTVWVLTCNPPEAAERLRLIRQYLVEKGKPERVIDIDLGDLDPLQDSPPKRAIYN